MCRETHTQEHMWTWGWQGDTWTIYRSISSNSRKVAFDALRCSFLLLDSEDVGLNVAARSTTPLRPSIIRGDSRREGAVVDKRRINVVQTFQHWGSDIGFKTE